MRKHQAGNRFHFELRVKRRSRKGNCWQIAIVRLSRKREHSREARHSDRMSSKTFAVEHLGWSLEPNPRNYWISFALSLEHWRRHQLLIIIFLILPHLLLLPSPPLISDLEKFIRRKYEFRRFMEKKPPPVPIKDASARRPPPSPRMVSSSSNTSMNSPPLSASNSGNFSSRGEEISRSRTAPIPSSWAQAQERASPKPTLPNRDSSKLSIPSSNANAPALPTRSASTSNQQLSTPSTNSSSMLSVSNGAGIPRSNSAAAAPISTPHQSQPSATSSVFDDLLSLSEPAPPTHQPPLQMNPWASLQQQNQPVQSPMQQQTSPYSQFIPNGHSNSQPAISINGTGMGMRQGVSGMGMGMGMNGFDQQQRSASLGNMAFPPSPSNTGGSISPNPFMNAGGMGMNQQQTGIMNYPTQLNTNFNNNSFSSNPYNQSPTSPTNPYLTNQNQSQSPMGFSSSPSNPYLQQTAQMNGQQQQQNSFNNWAGGMMPQQGTGFYGSSPFGQQQQQQGYQNQNGNMWGWAEQKVMLFGAFRFPCKNFSSWPRSSAQFSSSILLSSWL